MTKIANVILAVATLVLLPGFGAAQETQVAPTAAEFEQLVELAQSRERSESWPAVQQLGQIARTHDTLRPVIWDRAKVNTLGMKFIRADAGTFVMGPDRLNVLNVQPSRAVKISRSFYIAATEVTNVQFQNLFPAFAPNEFSPELDAPATHVMWDEAVRFCDALSSREGAVYRLPTEAEWELACRAGATTRYCFGDDHILEGIDILSQYAWWNDPTGKAHAVALLRPNNWGIYDMHGNADEWVADWYSAFYYWACLEQDVAVDPTGPESGLSHVLRGGSWEIKNHLALTCTSRIPLPLFDRKPFDQSPVGARDTVGFRIVREIDEHEEP